MLKKIVLLSAGSVLSLVAAQQVVNAQHSCYMVNADGSTVNLGHLCGEKPVSAESTAPASSTNAAGINPEARTVNPLPAPPVTNSSQTLYTPEYVWGFVEGCVENERAYAIQEGLLSYFPEGPVRSYCQCTIDTIQNTYTSQEFITLLDNIESGYARPAYFDEIDAFCAQRVFG